MISEIVSLRLRVNLLSIAMSVRMRMGLVQVAVLRAVWSSLHGGRRSHPSHVVSCVVGSRGDLQVEHAVGRIHVSHRLRIFFHVALFSGHSEVDLALMMDIRLLELRIKCSSVDQVVPQREHVEVS